MPYYPSKKRSWKPGKGKGSGGPPKKKSLTATVSALAKIVKKDHQTIARSLDYADYLYSANNAAMPYEKWYGQSILFPSNWSSTCRRSNLTIISPEAQLKGMTVSVCCNHNSSNLAITWYVAIVRAKIDWIPSTSFGSALRALVDFTDMGFGNAPVLNYDKFTLLKHYSFCTASIGQGAPLAGTARRVFKCKLNTLMKAAPDTSSSADQNWLGMNDTEIPTNQRLYVLTYLNCPGGVQWGTANPVPSMYTSVRFTTCQV